MFDLIKLFTLREGFFVFVFFLSKKLGVLYCHLASVMGYLDPLERYLTTLNFRMKGAEFLVIYLFIYSLSKGLFMCKFLGAHGNLFGIVLGPWQQLCSMLDHKVVLDQCLTTLSG